MAFLEEYKTLTDWVKAEMRARGIDSGRQLADWLGVSHVTANALLSPPNEAHVPRLSTLVQIAERTGANLFLLIALAYPEHRDELARLTSASPGVLLRAQLIEELPKATRQIIDGIILDADKRTGN